MNQKEFVDVLKRLYPSTEDMLKSNSMTIPKIANSAVEYLWMNQVPENDDTAVLRYQMECLESPGWFDFEDN